MINIFDTTRYQQKIVSTWSGSSSQDVNRIRELKIAKIKYSALPYSFQLLLLKRKKRKLTRGSAFHRISGYAFILSG